MGRITAHALAREGATVAVTDISEDGGNEAVRLITEAGGTARFHRLDVSDPDQAQEVVDTIVDQFASTSP